MERNNTPIFCVKVSSSWKFRTIMLSAAAIIPIAGLISELTETGTGLPLGFNFETFMLGLTVAVIAGTGFLHSNIELFPDGVRLTMFPIYRKFLTYEQLSTAKAVPLPLSKYGLGLRFYGGGNMGVISRTGDGVYLALAGTPGGYYVSTGTKEKAEALVGKLAQIRQTLLDQGT
ncbi:hypothetical protein ACXR2W_03040 [Leucobacter sp. HY1908]